VTFSRFRGTAPPAGENVQKVRECDSENTVTGLDIPATAGRHAALFRHVRHDNPTN
jgi:hypothetical protein